MRNITYIECEDCGAICQTKEDIKNWVRCHGFWLCKDCFWKRLTEDLPESAYLFWND